jgi:tetratricopeptide (TPR) repeat protein
VTAPYKGLTYYQEEDAPFFFGREWEQENIADNFITSRLMLLFGPSGVGKSSVLRAGVLASLRERNAERARQTPEFTVIVFSDWTEDPIEALKTRVLEEAARLSPNLPISSAFPTCTLTHALELWTEFIDSNLLIILDQFEAFFLYHLDESGEGSFFVELPRAINHPNLRVNFLIAMREDMLAELNHFKGHLPDPFRHSLRLRHLDREAAREAINNPIARYNELHGTNIAIEPELVEEVLRQVEDTQTPEGQAFRLSSQVTAKAIETSYLQLVMTRLWEEERRAGSEVLRLETLRALGGAKDIVTTHLERQMAGLSDRERELCARMFRHLVTPSGTKIALSSGDLASLANTPGEEVKPLLDRLSQGESRILNPIANERYEIFHDVLAGPVLDWQRRYEQEEREQRALEEARKLTEEENRQRELEAARKLAAESEARRQAEEQRVREQMVANRRLRRWAILAACLALVAALGAVFAGREYVRAEAERSVAERRAAELYAQQGRAMAREGNITLALPYFQRALEIDPDLGFVPEVEARRLAAPTLLDEARGLAAEGNREAAASAYQEAVDAVTQIDAALLNDRVCWHGSLDGFADIVLPACEQAVMRGSDENIGDIRDSRGLARALLGDSDGAIEDFGFYLEWASNRRPEETLDKRREWLEDLEAGEHPFDADTLEALRAE